MEKNIKAGFIGCGNMGGVLAAVAAKSLQLKNGANAEDPDISTISGNAVYAADHNAFKVDTLAETFGCTPSSASQIAEECDVIFLGVKPQVLDKACAEIKDMLAKRKDRFLVVSMAAGVKLGALKAMLGDVPIIRIMPNTPCAVGAGVILYCRGELASDEDAVLLMDLMRPAGIISEMDEKKLDMGSALTGCGPAFVYMFIDALIDGAVRTGLPRQTAKRFAVQTVLGSAMMCAQNGAEPAKLKADVCSPAGSTIEGVAVLEEYSLHSGVMEALKASYDRTLELGK
ncbi:MAG: pyrroline-5-carboxylate reductase [Firmicutes bacterium]|nr:pyrroline-5-carboxylate reductase [Bacillota bacterium]